jgi:hypothetical protein
MVLEDKGDTVDAETGIQEEDVLIHDEIYKSRIASIKRVRSTVKSTTALAFPFHFCYD